MDSLSHIDEHGQAKMVDVSDKKTTKRTAKAEAIVKLSEAHLAAINNNPKGDVFGVARIAGIQAAKDTAALIPLCHNLPLNSVSIDFEHKDSEIRVLCTAQAESKTGVEMESLVGATVAALTLYDMLKSAGHGIEIQSIKLLEKTGGKSDWHVSR